MAEQADPVREVEVAVLVAVARLLRAAVLWFQGIAGVAGAVSVRVRLLGVGPFAAIVEGIGDAVPVLVEKLRSGWGAEHPAHAERRRVAAEGRLEVEQPGGGLIAEDEVAEGKLPHR